MKRFTVAATFGLLFLTGSASADILGLTVDNKGTVALGGTVLLIAGTITCDVPPGTFFGDQSLFGNAFQVSVGGKVVSQGNFYGGSVQCAGAGNPVPYLVQLNTYGGSPFKPGPADITVTVNQFACSEFACTSTSKTVHDKTILNP